MAVTVARVHLTAGYVVVVPQFVANRALLSELAAVAAASGARFVEVMVAVERDLSLQRYYDRWRAGDDPVHGAASAPDLEEIGRTFDRLVAFAATRDLAVSLAPGTSDTMYRALLSVLEDRFR
jgi:hypothetical protein